MFSIEVHILCFVVEISLLLPLQSIKRQFCRIKRVLMSFKKILKASFNIFKFTVIGLNLIVII